MHNNKGFKKEIHQLKLTLKERKKEREFLLNELQALKNELMTFSGDERFEFADLNQLLISKFEQVDQNRDKLRQFIMARVDMNDNIFELTKRVKVLEGKILMVKSENLNDEKQNLSNELRKILLKIENKSHIKFDSESLKIQIQQQERLRIVLQTLMIELKNKIAYLQNTTYQQSIREMPYTPTPAYNKRIFEKPQPPVTKSQQSFSPMSSMSNYSSYSIQKRSKQYRVIVPSEIEFKNLVPKAHRGYVFRVSETLFEF